MKAKYVRTLAVTKDAERIIAHTGIVFNIFLDSSLDMVIKYWSNKYLNISLLNLIMVLRTYDFPEDLWKKFEILRVQMGMKKQEFFELIIKKGLENVEKNLNKSSEIQ